VKLPSKTLLASVESKKHVMFLPSTGFLGNSCKILQDLSSLADVLSCSGKSRSNSGTFLSHSTARMKVWNKRDHGDLTIGF